MEPLTLLTRLAALARLPRTGWCLAGVPAPESIAAHAHGVAEIALVLGPRVRPALDLGRALALCVVHDAPEALLGDLPRQAGELLPAGAKASAEERGAALLFAEAPELLASWREHQAGATREARFARLCDKLHLGLMTLVYARAGSRDLGEFRSSLEALDASEFAPCAELRSALLAALDAELRG